MTVGNSKSIPFSTFYNPPLVQEDDLAPLSTFVFFVHDIEDSTGHWQRTPMSCACFART
jgi:hypothetical protein